MDHNVSLEAMSCYAGVAALFASIGLFSSVCPLVLLESSKVDTGKVTLITTERFHS